MSRHEELLRVYRDHEDIGKVLNLLTDFDFTLIPAMKERPVNPDGSEGTGYDWFGTYWEYVPQQRASMVIDTPDKKVITDVTKWREQVAFPDLSQIDWEKEAGKDTKNWDRENKLTMVMLINGIFERSHELMGFEDALIAMYEEPEAYKELLDAICNYKIECIKIIGKYWKPDILNAHDDYGANEQMLMSVDMWEEFFKDNLQKVIDAAHEAGMLYEHHSCGYIAPIFDQLVEMGVDAIDPLQITNPLRELKDKYQHRITFCGGFDNQGILDKKGVTEEEVRREVRRTYDLLAPGGSYVAYPLVIQKEILPWMIDEGMKMERNYGRRNIR
ncbi:methylcobalamin:coenzyme M methyltransferase [uncultured Roseburia sp.]|uniref:Uroporphyrinogen decarboxylase (URO-D) domain-containing protein n=1 Tax=Brotonthovivens ammoniilytica TaxID=2981725 RepID=A0ABT2TGW6_9FIRM|nr:uroporphyrinogen decarboxylase family protein [Brotonthovivens ammoniilytica]MCU6761438.1 hypothetical protein [Brotonthovivens ammoniilytica]SCI28419.1 methylcobalamin:coenzyme M methyltransferase [uncultured Roseburia sp.]